MCTNFIVFLQEEKETVGMCTVYNTIQLVHSVLIVLISSGGERNFRNVY